MNEKVDLMVLLDHIHPSSCDYSEWTQVGMALKEEGYPVEEWEAWSAKDSGRYHVGECKQKWRSFRGNASPVTGGTIYQMAYDRGWRPDPGHVLDWDSSISLSGGAVVDSAWVEGEDVNEPKRWNPARQLIKYLEALFETDDCVGYVVKSMKNDKNKYVPKDRGNYKRTAGELIEALSNCNDDIGGVLGDYDPEGGAWIRFNPLDGKGVKNDNVTTFKYALVESDSMDIPKQNAIIRELELPVVSLVHSGSKSLHAIVKIDAADYKEYKNRVDQLYAICRKNGLDIDTQNKNPARLSRMPGVMRNGKKQFLVATNIGKKSWDEWVEWIESETDDLPDTDVLADVWKDMPPLAPELIKDILRDGHKMLIAGPSKAGKSFLLIELCIAIAEGREWIGKKCAKGNVLYVNLELDRASCLHRFRDVYDALGVQPKNLDCIDIWNLRGKSVPMDKLAPKLIRRARKKHYKMVIIDPIYKVITGDENSADQMAKFCNQFDLICTELGCAVAYCHHHSKGAQGGKRSMDRASGSGVFARDPDAMLDLIELPITEDLRKQERNKVECKSIMNYLNTTAVTSWDYKEDLSQDDRLNSNILFNICENKLQLWDFACMKKTATDAAEKDAQKTAWRIDMTLREFAKPKPINFWFSYPIHTFTDTDSLQDLSPESDKMSSSDLRQKRKEDAKKKTEAVINNFVIAFDSASEGGDQALMSEVAEQMGVSPKTIGAWLGSSNRGKPKLSKLYKKVQPDPGGPTYIEKKK